jgi:hypothetical protein
LGKVDIALLLVKDVFREFGDTLSVGLCFEGISLVLQDGLQFAVIRNDTIVNNDEFRFGVAPDHVSQGYKYVSLPVRVTIEWGRLTMRSPSSMGNTGMCHEFLVHVDMLLVNELPQCRDFADLLEEIDFILAVTIHSDTSRIVSTIL